MKEKWTKDIRERMVDYETPIPEGLWEDIEGEMRARGMMRNPHKPAAVISLRAKRIASVAAVLAIAFLVGRHVSTESPKFISKNGNCGSTISVGTSGTINHVAEALGQVDEFVPGYKTALSVAISSAEGISTIVDDGQSVNPTDSSSTSVPEKTEEKKNILPRIQPQSNRNTYYTAQNRQSARSGHADSRITASLFASGGLPSDFANTSTGMSVTTGVGPDGAEWEDSPLLGIAIYNQGREVKTSIKHHQPIRTGVTVSYALNDRFSIESGITYTRLNSDMRDGSESHYVEGTQSLHYVGVPLNAKYKFYSHKGLSLYASAGALVEKCVSGKQERTYVVDNKKELTDQDDVRPKSLQLSANAGIGAQYNVMPTVAVYAEPGVSYYFNDGSNVSTIYKEKPLNLNVNVGLRFTLGK